MAKSSNVVVVITIFMLSKVTGILGTEQSWEYGHATFYGDMTGSETMQMSTVLQEEHVAYGNLFQEGYGLETAALSTALFNEGLSCGACFEIKCYNDPQWCLPGTIQVTVTNFCPPNYYKTQDIWCNPPQKHFDLSLPMFLKIAEYRAGVVPVQYRRIPCTKTGGIKFEIKGNPDWILVLVYNVAGAGDVTNLKIKGCNTDWIQMSRNWRQNWQTSVKLQEQTLSFEVTISDGRRLQSHNVAPANWNFGQTYEGKQFY